MRYLRVQNRIPTSILYDQKNFKLSYKPSIKFFLNAQKLHDKVLHERGCQVPIHYCHNKPFILTLNQKRNISSGKKKYDTILGREDSENFIINEHNENKNYRNQPWYHQELLKNVTVGIAQYHPVTVKQSNMLCQGEELMVNFSE